MKPNVMCIGASKSGTTTLYNILAQHSQIFVSSFKEPHFFDIPSVYNHGFAWYQETYFQDVKNEKCIIDFTPTYLFEEDAPRRIHDQLGNDLRFIVILRDPVDRAYSHYLHSCRDMHENQHFADSLELENKRIQKDYLSKLRFSYISQGLYYSMLSNYLRFFPRENFLIINFEKEFIMNRKETIYKILSFLELDQEVLQTNIYSNKSSVPRYIWLKKLIKKQGRWREFMKILIPSLKTRQFIKNKLQIFNLKEFNSRDLYIADKKLIFEKYFKQDVELLEKLLNRKMYWNR